MPVKVITIRKENHVVEFFHAYYADELKLLFPPCEGCPSCQWMRIEGIYIEIINRLKSKGLLNEDFKPICCYCDLAEKIEDLELGYSEHFIRFTEDYGFSYEYIFSLYLNNKKLYDKIYKAVKDKDKQAFQEKITDLYYKHNKRIEYEKLSS